MSSLSKILLCAIITSIYSCQSSETNSESVEKLKFPVVIDTFGFQRFYKNIENQSKANYKPLYFGEEQDTVFADYLISFAPPPPPPPPDWGEKLSVKEENDIENKSAMYWDYINKHTIDWLDMDNFKIWDSSKIEIRIDTTQKISNINFRDSFICAFAYPVLLKNLEKDTILMSVNEYISIILEAKDSSGLWKPIEQEYRRWGCGMGLRYAFCPPNQIVLTSVPIYRGNYQTDLRLKLGKNYSKIFKGSINYSQFTPNH